MKLTIYIKNDKEQKRCRELDYLFFVCVLGLIGSFPLHYWSVEHLRLQEKYGRERGIRVGEAYGIASGYLFFLSWAGMWFSPQPRFALPFPKPQTIIIPYVDFSIPLTHLLISTPFLLAGAWFGIGGVKEVTLRVAETHRSERIVSTGVYSIVRHPQYLGGLLAHVGFSFLLSALYSLISTPLVVAYAFLIARKEEEELVREFGSEYEDYSRKVPMFIPRLRRSRGGFQRASLEPGTATF